ncbi:MAG: trehalose-phosphatase [Halofilum sp. (in: g-proteobacteria)]|nr:trehalose-phosphatase [Halofilum sp. (in: g-proteobacteria)]
MRAYPSTIALLERMQALGIPVGAFSASRNCEAVLQSAGLHERFDARVDGHDAERLGLPGKPDPAMLLEAARRLDVPPGRTAVIEDSVAGIQAAASGGFRPVIGVDRGGTLEPELRQAGADLVVGDAAELLLDSAHRFRARRLDTLPSVWDHVDDFRQRIAGRCPVVFLDYDGTLAPIVAHPEDAAVPESTRTAVAALAQRFPVAVISGRSLADLRTRLDLEGVYYAGSHGFEIAGPGGEHAAEHAREFLPELDATERRFRQRLAAIPGHIVERKPFAIALHYRMVEDDQVARMERIVDEVLAARPRLRKRRGKKVFQVQPRLEWDKGRAVGQLLSEIVEDEASALALYIGDDLTDEDVFRTFPVRGIGLVVRDGMRRTSADYALDDPDDVRRFLEALPTLLMDVDSCHERQT